MLYSLGPDFKPVADFSTKKLPLSPVDYWILSRAANAVKECDGAFR